MTPETAIAVFQEALTILILLVCIMLLPALAVGLLVSMFQAATQINEMTLSFIPKLLITLGVLMAGGPWMLQLIMDFAGQLIEQIPVLIG